MRKHGTPAPTRKPQKQPQQSQQRRGGQARAVAELLPDAGRAAFRRFGFVQSAVVSRWGEIVGPRYAGVCAPESIKFPGKFPDKFPGGQRTGGTLNLVVRGAHATMLQHIAPEIVERVNRFFGYAAVAGVRFRTGDVAGPAPRAAPPSPGAAPIELGASLRTIADPELRAVLEALAAGVAATRGAPIIGGGEE